MAEIPDDATVFDMAQDVADWLRQEAADYFGGDLSAAMNHHLRLTMQRQAYWRSLPPDPDGTAPRDPWERLTATLPPVAYPRPRHPDEGAQR